MVLKLQSSHTARHAQYYSLMQASAKRADDTFRHIKRLLLSRYERLGHNIIMSIRK